MCTWASEVVESSTLVHALQVSLCKHMALYKLCETYILAAVLDPHFKLKWYNTENQITAKQLLIKKYEPRARSVMAEIPSETDSSRPPLNKRKCLFSFFDNQDLPLVEEDHTCDESGVTIYLNQPYKAENCNPLVY